MGGVGELRHRVGVGGREGVLVERVVLVKERDVGGCDDGYGDNGAGAVRVRLRVLVRVRLVW